MFSEITSYPKYKCNQEERVVQGVLGTLVESIYDVCVSQTQCRLLGV